MCFGHIFVPLSMILALRTMNIHKNFFVLLLALTVFTACVGSGNGSQSGSAAAAVEPAWIESVAPVYGARNRQDSVQKITFVSRVKLDSAVLMIGTRRVGPIDTAGYNYAMAADHPVGRVVYHVVAYRGGEAQDRAGEFAVMASRRPVRYTHQVVKTYPHNNDAYTQGLLWHNGYLYESTGLEGHSSLRRVELKTGHPIVTSLLDANLFGEGLALLNGKLYQITWQNNKAFVYDVNTFEKCGEFDYPGEGWGLTTDGKYLYMSDGSEKIYVVDPATFRRLRTIEVYSDESKVELINEMEWIKGEIWANIYTTDTIVRIDPETGAVNGVIDMSGLLDRKDITPSTDVLNGIAYDEASGRTYVTGKNWNKLFEIVVTPADK